jgi:hypothetical protein
LLPKLLGKEVVGVDWHGAQARLGDRGSLG